MKKLILLLVALAFVGCADKCHTRTYYGNPKATKPNYTVAPIKKMLDSKCTSASCEYLARAMVGLHNPTKRAWVADIQCKYYFGMNYDAAKSAEKLNVAVKEGPISKYVEVRQFLSGPPGKTSSIGMSCKVTWR